MKVLYSIIGVMFLLGVAMTVPQTVSVVSAAVCGTISTGGCAGRDPGYECRVAASSADGVADVCTANAVGDCSCPNNSGTVDTNYLFGGDVLTEEQVRTATGLGNKDPREIIAQVINIVLGFLGIIAVILILLGGFKWMTANGNDESISGAKSLMMAGVVGLIIILAAFGIARFVVNALVTATGA